jgi:hypothetical protein
MPRSIRRLAKEGREKTYERKGAIVPAPGLTITRDEREPHARDFFIRKAGSFVRHAFGDLAGLKAHRHGGVIKHLFVLMVPDSEGNGIHHQWPLVMDGTVGPTLNGPSHDLSIRKVGVTSSAIQHGFFAGGAHSRFQLVQVQFHPMAFVCSRFPSANGRRRGLAVGPVPIGKAKLLMFRL